MPSAPERPTQDVPPAVRAQLLATEHWSLLASRSTTQNELLVRIGIFLTLVSAGVVSLALIGQATDFDDRFDAFTTVLFSILLLVGSLTLLRVINGGSEDAAYVIGMNRLRAAYAELTRGSTGTSSRPRTRRPGRRQDVRVLGERRAASPASRVTPMSVLGGRYPSD